jgi:hypothetical protein
MNALLPSLLSLALLAGCSPAPKDLRVDGSGSFTLTNTTGTVFWGHVQDSKTNDLQFILLLPDTDQFGSGSQTQRDGHQWKIEARGNLNTGTESLRFSDLTANTVTNIDLGRSRLWQISDDRLLIPLDKIDPTITERVLYESEAGFKSIQSLR